MSELPRLAVVGATGAVGQVICDVLGPREPFWRSIRLAAGADDVGQTCTVAGNAIPVEPLNDGFFDDVDLALFDVPGEVAREWIPRVSERGVLVIDNSPTFRDEPDVPLVVPEVNPRQAEIRPRNIIASPGATVMSMIDVLAVLHAGWELSGLVVTTFQAASGMGRTGISRLYDEVAAVAGNRELGSRPGDVRRLIEHELGESPFPGPLAYNLLPFVGSLREDGWTSEEQTVRTEVRKILGLPTLPVSATCVRVPVVSSHCVSLHATFERKIRVDEARQALIEAPGVVMLDDPEQGEFPTPNDVVGADPRFAGRLRQDKDLPKSLDLFIAGDNLRKGAGLNMVETAEIVAPTL